MSQFQENLGATEGRMEGQMDRSYFIGPFRLRPGVQKMYHLIAGLVGNDLLS